MQVRPKIEIAELYREFSESQLEINSAMRRCIERSSFINGPEVEAFENEFANYTNSPACAGVSSGTSAIMLALQALGVRAHDEVIVPTMSFISTAEVVNQLGATPVFVDIDEYYNIDIDQVESAITPRTTAIVFVNLYGQTVDQQRLKKIASTHNLALIEDAAQSAGCTYKGKPIGKIADATCYSFYPGKNLSAMGDAGAVTAKPDVVERIRRLRDHGRKEKYVHLEMGWNERLDGLHAAVLRAKLPMLSVYNSRRQTAAKTYMEQLKDFEPVVLPKLFEDSSHVYNQFVIQIEQRDDLHKFLKSWNISTGIQFPLSMHQQPVYNTGQHLPRSEKLAAHCLSLPVHPFISEQTAEYISICVKEFWKHGYASMYLSRK